MNTETDSDGILRFMSFSSGSCGNCYYLGDGDDGILIDAGVSLRRLRTALQASGLSLDSFAGILVTHDHMDHIRSLGSYCKKILKPVWATTLLHGRLATHPLAAPHITACRRDLREGEWNEVSIFRVKYFIVPHDATQTVGYSIDCPKYRHRFVIMTDIGRMTDEAINYAREADTLVIESNYDTDMLISGPYPHDLKMRICQGYGHLSNDECADAIRDIYHEGLRNIFLCHLSENNNTPDLAYRSAKNALSDIGVQDGLVNLRTLPRRHSSPLLAL
ncbi:MAG: MBL fold metallo-hydrolase [Bacteroidales bacterium]|nr:MBL fold metallo-hydrolase [Bacteroidales bacterium]